MFHNVLVKLLNSHVALPGGGALLFILLAVGTSDLFFSLGRSFVFAAGECRRPSESGDSLLPGLSLGGCWS